MGMFDQEIPAYVSGPQRIRRAGAGLQNQLAPGIKRMTGYESPKRQFKRMAAQTDLSDGQAVQQTYNAILAKNPTAAKKWLESVKPIINQHIEQQKIAATAKGKQGDRKIIKDAHGRQRYVDTEALVFPKVPDKPAAPKATSDPTKVALAVRLKELQTKYGKELGSQKYLAEVQARKRANAFASAGIVGDKVDYKVIPKMSADFRADVSDLKDNLVTIGKAKELLNKTQDDDSAVASELLNRELIKLVGDSQISTAEVNAIKSSGSLPERLSGALSQWVSGVPTDLKIGEIKQLLVGLEKFNKSTYNKRLEAKKAAYEGSTLPPEAINAILGSPYDLGPALSPLEAAKAELNRRQQGVK